MKDKIREKIIAKIFLAGYSTHYICLTEREKFDGIKRKKPTIINLKNNN